MVVGLSSRNVTTPRSLAPHSQTRLNTAFLALAICGAVFSNGHDAAAAEMQYPLDVAVAADGTIYVADRKLPGIWKVKDGQVTEYFKGSKKFRTPLNAIRCLAIDKDGKLLAGDSATREVYRFGDDGKPVPLTDGHIGIPMSIAVDKDGSLFVSDLELQRIWKVPAAGGKPEEVALYAGCRGLVFDAQGQLWALSTSSRVSQLVKIVDGKVVPVAKERLFQFPHNIVLSNDGQFIVSDGYAKALWKVSTDGKATKWASGDLFSNPVGLVKHGKVVLVADSRSNAILSVDADGKVTTVVASKPAAE